MIFSFVNVNEDEEIKLPMIKEKILCGGQEADYFEMFYCSGYKNLQYI